MGEFNAIGKMVFFSCGDCGGKSFYIGVVKNIELKPFLGAICAKCEQTGSVPITEKEMVNFYKKGGGTWGN